MTVVGYVQRLVSYCGKKAEEMFLRLTRYRLRAEWLHILLGVFLAAVFFAYSGYLNVPKIGNFHQFVATYSRMSPELMARSLGLDISELKPSLEENYVLLLQKYRGLFYHHILEGTETIGALPVLTALSVLFLTGPLRKKRLGPVLAAGYSRKRVFLSLTLVYYASVVLIWFLSQLVLLHGFSIRFSPEEKHFSAITRLAWFCSFLFRASVFYLAAFLLGKPLASALAGIGACILFGRLKTVLTVLPVNIVPKGPFPKGPTWEPGADLSAVETGIGIVPGVLILSVLIAWLGFRKRGLE